MATRIVSIPNDMPVDDLQAALDQFPRGATVSITGFAGGQPDDPAVSYLTFYWAD